MDGLATRKGSRVGVLLVSPQGNEIKIAVQHCFKDFNNETEYEALLVGLRVAKYVVIMK